MGVRILNGYEAVLGQEMEAVIFQALEAASMCWKPMNGYLVFDSVRAKQISDELMEVIVNYAQHYPRVDDSSWLHNREIAEKREKLSKLRKSWAWLRGRD
jgi:hypothetical protein